MIIAVCRASNRRVLPYSSFKAFSSRKATRNSCESFDSPRSSLLFPHSNRLFSSMTDKVKAEESVLDENNTRGWCNFTAGTIINGDEGERFEIIRKLGWGVNSTVWMARNMSDEDDGSPGHFLALKVLTSDASNEAQKSSTNELAMLLRTSIGQQPDHRSPTPLYNDEDNGLEGPPHLGWTRVAGFLGCFGFEQSKHLVIMSPLYGEHMKNYMRGEPNGRLSISLVKQVARETTLALDYLHNQCGIIHCDVKPENLMRDFDLGPDIDDIVEQILKLEPSAGRDGSSAPLWFPHVTDSEELHVVLADFSHASWNDLIVRSPRSIGSPALKAPELVLGFGYTTAIDIWALGCTIFELLSGKSLFRFSDSEKTPNELEREPQYHLSLMQSLLNEPFSHAASIGTAAITRGFIDEKGWIKSSDKSDTLMERLEKDLPHLEGDERAQLISFLHKCLRLDPQKRASAKDLLDDPWLTSH